MSISAFSPFFRRQLANNAYFSPVHQIFYLATPKVACTSLKWWFADLVGAGEGIKNAFGSLESDPELVIHDTFARVAPESTGTNESGLMTAIESDDYFKFCLVRNPYQRAFSAWQSKWLIREPLQADMHDDGVFEIKEIKTIDDLKSLFEAFLMQLAGVKNIEQLDVHVAPQAMLLEPELLHYDIVAHIEDPAPLVNALQNHLGPASRNPFAGKRANTSLLPYSSSWISDSAARLIREIYARDFEVFGYDLAVPQGNWDPAKTDIELSVRAIKLLRGRNQRIGELGAELAMRAPRVVEADKALSEAKSVTSSLQVYVSEFVGGAARPYSEERCGLTVYCVDSSRHSLNIDFPVDLNPVARLRLDIANSPSVIVLHGLSLLDAEGTELWHWNNGRALFQNSLGLMLRDTAQGLMVICFNNDPQFDLAIPAEVVAKIQGGASLVVDITPSLILDVLPDLFAQEEIIKHLPAPVQDGAVVPLGMSRQLVDVAQLMKKQIIRRNETIASQRGEIEMIQSKQRLLEEKVMRAEAQLELLKEFFLVTGQRNERL